MVRVDRHLFGELHTVDRHVWSANLLKATIDWDLHFSQVYISPSFLYITKTETEAVLYLVNEIRLSSAANFIDLQNWVIKEVWFVKAHLEITKI